MKVLAALACWPSSARGQRRRPSYNYVEGGYVATNGSGNADANGWGLNGSVAIAPNFHLFGGYSNQEIDNTNVDFDQWRVGVGYNHQISQHADLLTRVAYEKFDRQQRQADGWASSGRAALLLNFGGYAWSAARRRQLDGDYGRLGAQ